MWLSAKGRLVSLRTQSMSRFIAAAVRKSEPPPPGPPLFETAAANSPDVHVPIGARMIGTSMPSRSQSSVFSIVSFLACIQDKRTTDKARPTVRGEEDGLPCAQALNLGRAGGSRGIDQMAVETDSRFSRPRRRSRFAGGASSG